VPARGNSLGDILVIRSCWYIWGYGNPYHDWRYGGLLTRGPARPLTFGPLGELDEMTSADDFHLVSWRNFLGLSAIALGASLPMVLRRAFAKEEAAALEVERVEENRNNGELVLLSDSEDRSSAVEDTGDGSEDERAGQEGMMDDRRVEVV